MFLIHLAESRRIPPFRYHGASGHPYAFRWSDEHRAMVLEGRALTAEEFSTLAPEIFGADPDVNMVRPIPKFLGSANETGALQLPSFSGGELMRIASRIGELEIENAELRKGGVNIQILPAAQPVLPPPAIIVPPGGCFDPDEAPASDAPAPVAPVPKPAPRKAPPLPANTVPAPASGFYDPDEAAAVDMAQIS